MSKIIVLLLFTIYYYYLLLLLFTISTHSSGRQKTKDPSLKGAREAGEIKTVNTQTSIFLSLSNILSINIYLLSCRAQTMRYGPHPFSH